MNDDDDDGKYEYVLPWPMPIAKIEFALSFMNDSGFNDIEIEYCSKRMYCFCNLDFTLLFQELKLDSYSISFPPHIKQFLCFPCSWDTDNDK